MKKRNIHITILTLFVIFILTQIISLIYFIQINTETYQYFSNIDMDDEKHQNLMFCENRHGFLKGWIKNGCLSGWLVPDLIPVFQLFKKQKISNLSLSYASENSKKNEPINQSKKLAKKTTSFFYYSGWQIINALIDDKNSLLEVSKKYMTKNHFDLVSGMLFGDISRMGRDFKHELKVIGMLHVVSASGYNVSLLMIVIGLLFKGRVSRWLWFFIASLFICIYLFLAGFQPSIIRASIMSILGLFVSYILRRQYKPTRALIITAVLMLLVDSTLLESVSFQLSFLATLGIILFLSREKENNNQNISIMFGEILPEQCDRGGKISKSAVFSIFKDSFRVTLAAQLLVWPILLFHFGEFNVISLVVNTFLLWLTPLITIFGGIFVLSAYFFDTYFFEFGKIVVKILYLFLWTVINFFELMVGIFSKFEWLNYSTDKNPPLSLSFLWWGVVIIFLKLKRSFSCFYEKPTI